MALNATVMEVLIELAEHLRLEWLIRRRSPQGAPPTGGPSQPLSSLKLPEALAKVIREKNLDQTQQEEREKWLVGLSSKRRSDMERLSPATLDEIFTLGTPERRNAKLRAYLGRTAGEFLGEAKDKFQSASLNLPETAKTVREIEESRKRKDATARQVGAKPLWRLIWDFFTDDNEKYK